MRPFWFALKIAALFTILTMVVLASTFMLFGRVVGHALIYDLASLRAHEGVAIADQLEPLLDERSLEELKGSTLQGITADSALSSPGRVRLLDPAEAEAELEGARHGLKRPHSDFFVQVRGRRCKVLGDPGFETLVPVLAHGSTAGYLSIRGPIHSPVAHAAFLAGVLEIGAITMLGVIGLAVYLTAPLRSMSRAMDRIAAGQLDHRVPQRGHDEVAAMGRSFNLMADRIHSMISGQKELLASVSHELRSPLARMKMILELLRDGTGGPADPSGLDQLEAEVDEIDALVGELLVASRLELGTASLNRQVCDLDELAREAWTRVAADADRLGMSLERRIDCTARHLLVDRALIVRLLGNLLENAVRYAGRGRILLTAERRGALATIRISDEGPGVDHEHLDRLFEPFYRADPSRSRRTGASGLGLMIVRRAVEAHGGTVRAVPAGSGGLAVILDLPAAPDATS